MCTDESQTEPEDVFRGLTYATWQTMLPAAAGDEAVDVSDTLLMFGFQGQGEAPFMDGYIRAWVSDGFVEPTPFS
jgi:hypothetical protein